MFMKLFLGTIILLQLTPNYFSQGHIDVFELGRNITDTIKNPAGTADELIGNIFRYFEALRKIHFEIKKDVEEGIKHFYKLEEEGGPPFLRLLPVDEKPLRDFYKWSQYQGIEFRGFLKYNEDEWADMKELINKNRSKEHWTT
jgi:hypothetical protein